MGHWKYFEELLDSCSSGIRRMCQCIGGILSACYNLSAFWRRNGAEQEAEANKLDSDSGGTSLNTRSSYISLVDEISNSTNSSNSDGSGSGSDSDEDSSVSLYTSFANQVGPENPDQFAKLIIEIVCLGGAPLKISYTKERVQTKLCTVLSNPESSNYDAIEKILTSCKILKPQIQGRQGQSKRGLIRELLLFHSLDPQLTQKENGLT